MSLKGFIRIHTGMVFIANIRTANIGVSYIQYKCGRILARSLFVCLLQILFFSESGYLFLEFLSCHPTHENQMVVLLHEDYYPPHDVAHSYLIFVIPL